MTNQNNAARAANPEIRAAFELSYAVDANDPAIVTDLGHFTNGRRACIMSQVRAPVADERVALSQYDYQALFDAIGKAVKVHPNLAIEISVQAFRSALASAHVADVPQDTGNPKADRLIARLMSSDPDFDDCAAAARLIRDLASAPVAGEEVGKVVLFGGELKEVSWRRGKMPPPGTTLFAAPPASEAQCSCPSGDGSLRWPCAAHGARPGVGRLKQLAAALGNRDWKWWDSCSFRRLTFEDGPQRRDGSALHATVQASDGHPDVNMAPGVREFIEAASPMAVGQLATIAVRLEAQLRECTDTLGSAQIDEHRAMRAYADSSALLAELDNKLLA